MCFTARERGFSLPGRAAGSSTFSSVGMGCFGSPWGCLREVKVGPMKASNSREFSSAARLYESKDTSASLGDVPPRTCWRVA